MLTGIGADGTKYNDGVTFASELALGEDSPVIELPNDADPKGDDVRYRLRLFLLLMSLDWLAHGEFGPYAASVSKARRPCFKCKWAAGCPCAFMSRDDPRRRSVTHIEHCVGSEPRTHAGVMETVAELRRLATLDRTITARKRLGTETGVFTPHFASEHLLRDVVRDPAVDIMHVYFAGKTRYLISWMTDHFIPDQFEWADLNKRKNSFPFKRSGVRVPDLERSKGDHRQSCSIHLNAAQTMAFTIARSPQCSSHAHRTPPTPHAHHTHPPTCTHALSFVFCLLVCSPVIMGPLIENDKDPVWECWLAHVAEVRFSVRRAFVRGVDGETMSKLHNKFLEKFSAVPQWQDCGYEKPKFHPSEHLAEQLEEFGPFRASWCFPWEAYLQAH